MSANNVPQEAISIRMAYVLPLILIAKIPTKEYAFLAMMVIHYKAISALNHRFNLPVTRYARNGKVKSANNALLEASWDCQVNVLLSTHSA